MHVLDTKGVVCSDKHSEKKTRQKNVLDSLGDPQKGEIKEQKQREGIILKQMKNKRVGA